MTAQDSSAMPLVRIGMIGTDNLHAYAFASFINGWAEQEPIPVRLPSGVQVPGMYSWATLLRRMAAGLSAERPVSGARVTSIWSADRREAELIARGCGISTVCEEPADACEDVDAVMVLSERPESHLLFARPALERGLPTYVDKPLAESVAVGREIFALADRHRAKCFTGSAVRWSRELRAERDFISSQHGDVRGVHVSCPRDVEFYGIHAVEMINLFLGCEVASVQAMGCADREVVLLSYRNGASALFENLKFMRSPILSVTAYGETWTRRIVPEDGQACMLALVKEFVAFAQGGQAPVGAEESLRLIGIVAAARESLRSGQRVHL